MAPAVTVGVSCRKVISHTRNERRTGVAKCRRNLNRDINKACIVGKEIRTNAYHEQERPNVSADCSAGVRLRLAGG